MMEGIQNFLSACNVVVLSRGHSLFSVGRNVCMCTVQGTAVKDRHVWPVGPFVPASLGNQTQPRSWRIEHLQLALMQLWDADWQRANSVHHHPPPPPVPSDPLSFACSPRDCRQQRDLHKDKLHRALWQAAGSLCGDAILFPLQQMSALLPLPSSLTSVCVLSFFSRDPSCPGRFLFYIWKSRVSAQSLSYQL